MNAGNMMTDRFNEKLYLVDPYLTHCQTRVLEHYQDRDGFWVRLDQTIFYPEGGGQSSDRGWIGDQPVRDVQIKDHIIWHLTDQIPPEDVGLKLDWNWRYGNMQQHTGQHILSACFAVEMDIDTVSVHLGSTETMIELNADALSETQIAEVQEFANKIIRAALPVEAKIVPREDMHRYPIRRKIKFPQDDVRLLFIGNYDCTGCGGTHVRNTAEVGLIKLTGTEKIRGHTRVHAKIGNQAYRYFDQLENIQKSVSMELSAGLAELPQRIDALISELKILKHDHHKLTEKWLDLQAESISGGESIGFFVFEDLSAADLQYISAKWVDQNNLPCYFVTAGKTATRFNFVFRAPQGSPVNGSELIGSLSSAYGIKGGGGRDFITGIMTPEKWDEPAVSELKNELIAYLNNK